MSQPAHSEEDLLTNPIKLSTKMVPGGSRPHRSPCQNFSPDSASSFLGLALSRNPTPASAPILALAPTPAPIPTLSLASAAINDLFKQFIKAYLETNLGPR